MTCCAAPSSPDGVQRREPWPYMQREGEQITTRHYQILTTAQHLPIAQALPAFLEASLARHRQFAGGGMGGPALPAPPGRMQLFLFADREEWAQFTRATVDESAHPLLAIEVGGYSAQGRAVLFALPPRYERLTLKIAAHEGWHQYVQRAFKEPLPTWADEMIAVMAEGYLVDAEGQYRFEPVLNPERMSQLETVLHEGRWRSLEDMLAGDPTRLLGSEPSRAVDYYAQLWALGVYLALEPQRWAGVERLLRDAARGRMQRELGHPDADELGRIAFTRYVASDVKRIDAGYRAFARALVDESSAERRSGSTPR
ncbi:MAG: hypothetical protein ACIAQU_09325 [Phycisphaerales bacterium JB064]